MDSKLEWYSEKKGFFRNDSIPRTRSLVDEMEKLDPADFHAIKYRSDNKSLPFSLSNCGILNNNMTSEQFEEISKSAIEILKKTPKMLEYTFDKDGKLVTIVVHNAVKLFQQFKEDDKTLCKKACIVHAALEMFMHLQAVNRVGSNVPYAPPAILMTRSLSEKCELGSTGYNAGAKSQRKRRNRTRHRHKHNARPTKRRHK